jgi:hypothetical protein
MRFEIRLTNAKVFHIGMLSGLAGGLIVLETPDFYRREDWQIARQIGNRGTWNVKPITDYDLTIGFARRSQFCRPVEIAETSVGIGFVYIENFNTHVDVFLSPAKRAGGTLSVYDDWTAIIGKGIDDRAVEVVLLLNVGVCTDQEIADFRDGKWLGTKDIALQVRPLVFG